VGLQANEERLKLENLRNCFFTSLENEHKDDKGRMELIYSESPTYSQLKEDWEILLESALKDTQNWENEDIIEGIIEEGHKVIQMKHINDTLRVTQTDFKCSLIGFSESVTRSTQKLKMSQEERHSSQAVESIPPFQIGIWTTAKTCESP